MGSRRPLVATRIPRSCRLAQCERRENSRPRAGGKEQAGSKFRRMMREFPCPRAPFCSGHLQFNPSERAHGYVVHCQPPSDYADCWIAYWWDAWQEDWKPCEPIHRAPAPGLSTRATSGRRR